MEKYNYTVIESKWQSFWEEIRLFKAEPDSRKPKYYCLTMYPYPSGTLHMGHVINYTLGDAAARYHMMKGANVLAPMGWDSFGLPAENAAIREKIAPAVYTAHNINRMRDQMRRAGWGFDWDREVATSHPGYYRWTQWIFLKLYEAGMAFKKNASVNWCPSCNTVLANEQVKDDACERCNTPIEQKDLNQWFFRMSAYAERLLDNHRLLAGRWPERVLRMQAEWIGRSEGTLVDFRVESSDEVLPIFTTRPDTLYGVTFLAIAARHPLIEKLVAGQPQEAAVMAAVKELRKQTVSIRNVAEITKAGVDTGITVINPVNGAKIALWAANFVLMEYGTGIIMAVPAHDQRDFEFAREYKIPVKVVIVPEGQTLDPAAMDAAYTDPGIMVDSGPFNGQLSTAAMQAITDHVIGLGCGRRTVNYRLKDWLLSRQRYWGAPIPIVYCDTCGAVPVPEADLPVLLPENVEFKPTGESPLARCPEFVKTACPRCGKPARRETDTMDTFVDSSWYFLRYLSPRCETAPFQPEAVNYWMPVDQYIGGIEHATMHLVYCRFLMLALKDLGLVGIEEPVARLFCQGMVCKVAHYCKQCKWLAETDVDLAQGLCRKCGGPVKSEMAKISKTKLNTVSPDAIMDEFGADTMRLNILADNPPDQEQVWSDDSLRGAHKFLNRLFALVMERLAIINQPSAAVRPRETGGPDRVVLRKLHQTIAKVTECIAADFHFNTGIASVFELVNLYRSTTDLNPYTEREVLRHVVLLLAPITPHICEELWRRMGGTGSIFREAWPVADNALAAEDEVEIVVQINGKVRSKLSVPVTASKADIEKMAKDNDRIQALIAGRTIRKVIVVPARLVNIVVAG